ncbi:hypothetical protein ULMS_02790 [Patiriisocius marinistellae]|uniref:DUF4442 domain-containing protein n=1 Tax=Patiriisocius marinistellae TaxID=2494560 RepID=A0A5J4FYN5_9FLAO|nr:DUF4442 domain-containing protein [Patiriisocius marinistellae]GEQ84771.1 hypothetical protein ULMS_02790 [Patiriisocius marinistellae]
MSLYQKLEAVGLKFFKPHTLFKYGFNFSPMYRRSTARITHVSKDIMKVTVKLPVSWKNRNYMNSIYGGSLFSAVDPIPMIQLVNILGKEYVVWDKSAVIHFKRPAKENVYADFIFNEAEISEIRKRIAFEKEFDITKSTSLTNKEKSIVYCTVDKTIYIAEKQFYKAKRAKKQSKKAS